MPSPVRCRASLAGSVIVHQGHPRFLLQGSVKTLDRSAVPAITLAYQALEDTLTTSARLTGEFLQSHFQHSWHVVNSCWNIAAISKHFEDCHPQQLLNSICEKDFRHCWYSDEVGANDLLWRHGAAVEHGRVFVANQQLLPGDALCDTVGGFVHGSLAPAEGLQAQQSCCQHLVNTFNIFFST